MENPTIRTSEKRELFIGNLMEQLRTGEGTLADAYLNAGYKAKNRIQANDNAKILKKHPEVQFKLLSYKEEIMKLLPTSKRAKIMVELAQATDKRVQLQALQEISRILDEYPAGKLKVQQVEEERQRILDEE